MGQGISLIIFGGIVSGIIPGLAQMFTLEPAARIFSLLTFLLYLVLTVLVIVIIQEGQRRIAVQYLSLIHI